MIEYLFPENILHKVKPPKMNIGEFTTFKGYYPFGKGQQAVHNSGSSMLKDTPNFKTKVLTFINDHFICDLADIDIGIHKYIEYQVDSLLKFKSDQIFRTTILTDIFNDISSFSFSNNISSNNLFISLILFFVKEYNFIRSTHYHHNFTKSLALQYYSTETELLNKYSTLLQSIPYINYLSDICYGRYYFLEVHFQNKQETRNVPKEIVREFLNSQKIHMEDYNLAEQKIILDEKFLTQLELSQLNNRKPKLTEVSGRKSYAIDPRIAKAVLTNNKNKCEIDESHTTFYTKKGITFSESHHLIPMSFQKHFLPFNLDREENITSLCPNCHRAVHLGNKEEKRERLFILYNKKITELNKCGIILSFEDLLTFY